MKRIVQAVLGSAGLGVLIFGFAAPVQAADAGTIVFGYDVNSHAFAVTPGSITGAVGDTFTLENAYSAAQEVNGPVALSNGTSCVTGYACTLPYSSGQTNGQLVLMILGGGTVSIIENGVLTRATFTVTVGEADVAQTPPKYEFTYWLPGTPAVECGPLRQTVVSGTQVSLPGADADCKTAGQGPIGWSVPGSTDVFSPGAQVIVSGDQKFTAVFADPSLWVTQNANVGSGVPCLTNGQSPGASFTTKVVLRTEVKLGTSAPCAPAGLSLKGWNTKGDGTGKTYAPGATVPIADIAMIYRLYVYAVWGAPTLVVDPATLTVQTGSPGTIAVREPGMAGQSVSVSASGSVALASGASSTVTLGADGSASVSFVAGASTGAGSVTASSGGVTATATISVAQPVSPSIVIVGARTTVSGKPGVMVDGQVTGLAPGSTVTPLLRFPGQTSYTEGSARPVVQQDGSFTWQRKTGKKVYVYITSGDGKVQSNRVIIPAN